MRYDLRRDHSITWSACDACLPKLTLRRCERGCFLRRSVTGMASLRETLEADLNVDAVLQQYMFQIEHCTTDLPQAPPFLQDLTSISNLQQPTSTADVGFFESLIPFALKQPSSSIFPDSPGREGSSEQEAEDTPGHNTTTGTKRTEAWAAKNRRAQKRFRERQKVSGMPVLFSSQSF